MVGKTAGIGVGFMYGPSPDCKRDLLMAGSGLLLCIRLLSEAMDLLRAMMESAPSLSSTPRRPQLQTVNPIRIRAGRLDLFSHQSNLLANLVRTYKTSSPL